ncbi:MAG TPA: low molecular weight protein-tyrosine-phosphatase [Burkholderiales bacterium]|nr:low molecular weight protein-tyrosine-phosphatase [Burkholderiales bacterium]
MPDNSFRLLFVCTGNICRSPTAEGVFRAMAEKAGLQVHVDSAGTHGYHAGEAPDRAAVAHALRRGYDISGLRARQVAKRDFEAFDMVIAMDRGQLLLVEELCAPEYRHKLRLMLDFAGLEDNDIPDPYGRGPEMFELVLDMVEAASRGLLDHVRNHLLRVST